MPRIEITPTVRVALIFLRVYLIALLILIVVKFVLLFSHDSSQKPKEPRDEKAPASYYFREDKYPGGPAHGNS